MIDKSVITATPTENDFGFSFHDESDISDPIVTNVRQGGNKALVNCQAKLDDIMNLIMPFLKNLQADPTKLYLKWPDRANKVLAFQKQLNVIATRREP